MYVGEATNDSLDQVLEDIEMPITQGGTMRFDIQASPPDPSKIPPEELVGVTAILVTCSYDGKDGEFRLEVDWIKALSE